MIPKQTKDSVPKEQFNDEKEVIENTNDALMAKDAEPISEVDLSKTSAKEQKKSEKEESESTKSESSSSKKKDDSDNNVPAKYIEKTKTKSKDSSSGEKETVKKEAKKKGAATKEEDDTPPVSEKKEKKKEPDAKDKKGTTDEKPSKPKDYSYCKKNELIEILKEIIENKPVNEIRADIDSIKINFYKKHKAEIDIKKRTFIDNGGELEDFKPEVDPLENELKELLKKYKELKAKYNSRLELQKQENLKLKYEIIEEIKHLVNRKESINKTFQEFRELQNKWREIGIVPQQNVKDLWETYHLHVAKFYDHIKINKELRDLDLKKNLEEKVTLCEKAEELLFETSVIKAFNELQALHAQWREVGPVPNEMKDEIWERFKTTTTKINKRHQEHFENLKKEQKKNLESKILLCEKAEEISIAEISSHKEWEEKSRELIDIQKVWRTIGFAPKKDNNRIYKRFRDACDKFFARKREFYAENKELQENNLQCKTDLCIQAESLKDSTEWKKTTEDLIQLQKQWKTIGPVPKKHSENVWKRFRSTCDYFFEQKAKYFKNIDKQYDENLKKKEQLIDKIKKYKINNDKLEDTFTKLKEFQKEWSEIGFVPLKKKNEIQEKYRKALQDKFENLDVDEQKKSILRYKSKLDDIVHKPKSNRRLKIERDSFINKIKKLESDIVLWENNIGFFIKSKNADAMIKEVQDKIDTAKDKIMVLEEKIKLIDNVESS